ncbi:hypothetical protein LTR47_011933, partial [Exophiala xenobiotica]
ELDPGRHVHAEHQNRPLHRPGAPGQLQPWADLAFGRCRKELRLRDRHHCLQTRQVHHRVELLHVQRTTLLPP